MKKLVFRFTIFILLTAFFLGGCRKDNGLGKEDLSTDDIKIEGAKDKSEEDIEKDLAGQILDEIFGSFDLAIGYSVEGLYSDREIEKDKIKIENLAFKKNPLNEISFSDLKSVVYKKEDYPLFDSLKDGEFGSYPIYREDQDYMLVCDLPKVMIRRIDSKNQGELEELVISENSYIRPEITPYKDGIVYSLIEPELGKSSLNYYDFKKNEKTLLYETEVRFTDDKKDTISGGFISALAEDSANIYFQVSYYEDSPLYEDKPIKNELYFWDSFRYYNDIKNVISLVEGDFPPMEKLYCLEDGILTIGRPFGEGTDQYLAYYKIKKMEKSNDRRIKYRTKLVDKYFSLDLDLAKLDEGYLILARNKDIYYFDEESFDFIQGERGIIEDLLGYKWGGFLINYKNKEILSLERPDLAREDAEKLDSKGLEEEDREGQELVSDLGKKIFDRKDFFKDYMIEELYPKVIRGEAIGAEDLAFKKNPLLEDVYDIEEDIIYRKDNHPLYLTLKEGESASYPIYSYDGDYILVWDLPRVSIKKSPRSRLKSTSKIEEIVLSENAFIKPDFKPYKDGIVYSLAEPGLGKSSLNYLDFRNKEVTKFFELDLKFKDASKKSISGQLISALERERLDSIYFQVSKYEDSKLDGDRPIENNLFYFNGDSYYLGEAKDAISLVSDDFPYGEEIYNIGPGLVITSRTNDDKLEDSLVYYGIVEEESEPEIIGEYKIAESGLSSEFDITMIKNGKGEETGLVLDKDGRIAYFNASYPSKSEEGLYKSSVEWHKGEEGLVYDLVYLDENSFLLNYKNEKIYKLTFNRFNN